MFGKKSYEFSLILGIFFIALKKTNSKKCHDKCSQTIRYFDNCRCDDQCHIYNDCCVDKLANYDENLGMKCNIKLNSNKYMYSVEKCAAWWLKENPTLASVQNKCEISSYVSSAITSNPYQAFFNFIPVYSHQNNLTYKNINCAKCNLRNMDKKELRFFSVDSSSDLPFRTESELLTIIDQLIKGKENQDSYVEIRFIEPNDTGNYRECIKNIEECPNGEKNSSLIEMCKNQTALRYTVDTTVYKNEFCAMCNGISPKSLHCFDQKARSPVAPKNQNLQILFDLSDLTDEFEISLRFVLNNAQMTLFENMSKSGMCINGIDEWNKNSFICKSYRLKKRLCDGKESLFNYSFKMYLTVVGQLISIFSLILLLLLYFSSKLLRNLPGKILICMCLALLLSQFFFLLSTYGATPYDTCDNDQVTNSFAVNSFTTHKQIFSKIALIIDCYIYGILTHYFYLSFFVWSNIMAYDLYIMFMAMSFSGKGKSRKNLRASESTSEENNNLLLKYMFFGWIAPFSLVFALWFSQFVFKNMAYGFRKCYISNQIDLLVFMALPVTIMLTLNCYYLVCSIKSIMSVDKMSKKYLRKEESVSASLISSKYSF